MPACSSIEWIIYSRLPEDENLRGLHRSRPPSTRPSLCLGSLAIEPGRETLLAPQPLEMLCVRNVLIVVGCSESVEQLSRSV